VVLGGEVGSGKSALTLAIAVRASDGGTKTRFLSGEMEQTRAAERALAIEARVRVDDLRRGNLDDEARGRLEAAAQRLGQQFPSFGTIDAGGTAALEQDTTRLRSIDLLIVDPLQSLATGARTLDEDLAAAARALKRIAVEYDLCVVATTHLPAIAQDRKDPRPQLDDFGALGAVKQFADVVLGLYRQEMYESAPDVDGATELLVLKNRNGARGYVDLFFYKQWMRFEDMLEPDR
jgi:replicative DNA helicase